MSAAKVYFDGSSLHEATRGYFNAIKDALKPDKFYVQAPTPQLLRKAQKAAVELRRPIPRDAQGRILPHPSRGTKSDIFKKEDFKDVDNHALNAPPHLVTASIEELVDYLVGPYQNDDVSAVRAIFRWISGQDLRDYEDHPDASQNSAAYHLNGLKNGRGRYDKIFNLMCEHARIPSASISGHSKGIGYNVGDPLTPSTRNMWNAVLLGNDWYLIDVHWASRKVSGVEAEEWQHIELSLRRPEQKTTPHDIYEFDEFYFLTNPEEFIYSHFPDQEVWQLLARPMTPAEFPKVIHLKPTFFRFGLKVKTHPWCTLKSVDGAVNIELTTECEDLSFSYELYRSTKVDCGQQKLDRYLFLERSSEDKKMCIEVRFPTTGKFKCELYGKESKGKLEWLCSYVLYCEKPEANCLPLPTNLRSEWGPGVEMSKAGVIPLTHKRGKIFVDSIETQIKFKLKLDVDLIAQIMTVDEEKLDKYVLLGVTDNIATVNVRIPEKGHYALCIFAKTDPYQQQFVNICNYLLKCTEDFGEVEPYPQTNNSRVGPMDMFHKLGLKMTDSLPGLSTVPRDGMFAFSIVIPEGTDYFPRMTSSTNEDSSDYVGWHREDDVVHFELRFPKAGFHKFNLFAKSENDEGGYPEVLCLVFEVTWPMTNCLPFPKRFTRYQDDYQICSPNQRLLAIGKMEKVSVFIPDVEEVALIEDGSWTHLKLNEDDDMWQGQINPTGSAETISMAVKSSETNGSFSAILSYEVIPEKDLNRIYLAQRLALEEADQDYLEQMSLRNNASKKSQGDSMMNQIQRIAKMKQQNLDDETLQRIQLQVEDDNDNDDFENSNVSNGEMSQEFSSYLEGQSGYDNSGFTDTYEDYESEESYDQNENDDNMNDDAEREVDYDVDDEEQNLISGVDINLNDIRKDNNDMNKMDYNRVEVELCPQNNFPTNEHPIISVNRTSSSNGFGEVTISNIPLRIGSSIENDNNVGIPILDPQYVSQTNQQPLLEGSVDRLSDSGNFENRISGVQNGDDSIGFPILEPQYVSQTNQQPLLQGSTKSDRDNFSDSGNSENGSDSELSQIDEESMEDIKPDYVRLNNSALADYGSSPLAPKIDEVSAVNIKHEEMHLSNASPPPPPPPDYDLSPFTSGINKVSALDVEPNEMHLYNAAPPPPRSPGGVDFTEQLVKKVAEIEKSVEKGELALENFSYQELKGMDENVLRPRQGPLPVLNEAPSSTFIDDGKHTSIVRPFVATEQKDDEEVPLIKFVEYFIYFISLLSLLLYLHRILTWRRY